MYNVSNSYKSAALQPVQEHRLTGTIGSVSFDENNIVSGTFNISKQCTDTSDVVLGSCYIGQLTATFTGVNINRGAWYKKVITPYFGLKIGNNTWENVPLGVFRVKDVHVSAEGVEVVAYDNMAKFDKVIKHKKNTLGFVTDSMYDFISLACTKCHVTLGMTKAQIDALPNGYRSQGDIEIYGDAKATDFANDIETYRDLLYWCAQAMGCFATIDRTGQLVFRQYTQTIDETISDNNRLAGAVFDDYTTHYTGLYFTDMDTNEDTYYGYDVEELQAQITETEGDITETEQAIADNADDLVDNAAALTELENKHNQGQITDEEYARQKNELDNERDELLAEKKRLEKLAQRLFKRLTWLQYELAEAQAEDDGATMDCGANPFLQFANLTKRDNTRRNVLAVLDAISYTPFTCSLICGAHYDLGDILYFTGGHANNDICCVMAWSYTHNQGTEIQGFGVDPSQYMVKNKNAKNIKAAKQDVSKAPNISVNKPVESGKSGDMIINLPDEDTVFIIPQAWAAKNTVNFDSTSGIMSIELTDIYVSEHPIYHWKVCEEEIVTEYAYGNENTPYYFSFDAQFSPETQFANTSLLGIGFGNLTRYVDAEHAPEYGKYYVDGMDGSWDADEQVQSLYRDHNIHHYEGVCYPQLHSQDHYVIYINFYGLDITNASPSMAQLHIQNMRVIHYANPQGIHVNDSGTWKQIPYVRDVITETKSVENYEQIATIDKGDTIKGLFAPKTKLKPADSNTDVSQFKTSRLLKVGDNTYKLKSAIKYANMLNRGVVVGRRDEIVIDNSGNSSIEQNDIYVPRIPTKSKAAIPVLTSNTSDGTASASNYFDDGHKPWKAFDKDNETSWRPLSGTENPFLMYQFAASVAPLLFDTISIKFHNLGNDAVTIHANIKGLLFNQYGNPYYEICTVGDVYAFNIAANGYTDFTLNLNQKDYYGIRIEFVDVIYSDSIFVEVTEVQLYTIVAIGGSEYTLPVASENTLGGIKVGQNLSIDENGRLNAQGGTTINALNDIGDVDITSPSNGQVLKYDATNQEWVNANESGGVGQVSALAYKQLTQQEYDALSTAEKNNGTVYFISANSTGVSGLKIITISQSDYDNLSPAEKNNGIPYFIH